MDSTLRGQFGFRLMTSVIVLAVAGCSKPEPAGSGTKTESTSTSTKPVTTASGPPGESHFPNASPQDTLVALLNTLPKDLWPRSEQDISRIGEINKWLKENVSGKPASVTSSLERINITPPSKAGEKFRLALTNGAGKRERHFHVIRGLGQGSKVIDGLDLWGLHWSVDLHQPDAVNKAATLGLHLSVDKPELDRLRTLETRPDSPDVRLTFTIVEIGVERQLVTITVKDLVVETAKP